MFNIFRNPFIDAQVGYFIDSMIDARRKETEEYWRGIFEKELDIEYWRGYNDAMVAMSKNDDNDGWYTNGTTYMTKEHIVKQWNELFDAHPWLEGIAADDNCGIIDCCPEPEPQDWLVFDQISTLLWLSNLQDEKVLSKDLIQKIGGTQ